MAAVVGWRIVRETHAHDAFSGEGARLYGGRWNPAGVKVIYCSENLALAALEILVHTQPVVMQQAYRAFRVSFPARLMQTIELPALPKGWNAQPPTRVSQEIGARWIAEASSAVLALPSVIIPLERTFLLNPAHRDFGSIGIDEAGPIALDHRLI